MRGIRCVGDDTVKRRCFRCTAIAGLLVAGLLAAGIATTLAAGDASQPAHAVLVRQLGASSYTMRERAARQLLEIGIAAKPALVRGMEHEDLEIRLGAHRILVQVMQQDFDARIAAFIQDEGGSGTHDLAGWPMFREQLEDTEHTRRLYAEMLRAENDLIVATAQKDPALEQMLVDRIQYLTSSRARMLGHQAAVTDATLATLLFVGQQAQQTRPEANQVASVSAATSRIYSLLNYSASKNAMLQGAYAPQMKQLLAGWIDGLTDSPEQYGWSYAMQLALKFNLREQGPRVARKVLEQPGHNSSSIPYAAIVLGRFGTAKDIEHLAPHLDNKQVFHTWSNRNLKKEPIRIQIRDAVLAMMIRLKGENPAAYGFELLQGDEQYIYKIYTLGFLEDSQRDAALAKWHDRDEQKKEGEQEEAQPVSDQERAEAAREGEPQSGDAGQAENADEPARTQPQQAQRKGAATNEDNQTPEENAPND